MRFLTAVVATTFASASTDVDYCRELCRADPNCDTRRGSYCKSDHAPQTCYAYYFETVDKSGPFYYFNPDIRRNTETPVLCTDAEDILNRSATTTPEVEEDYCTLLCSINPDCLESGRGSYTKHWQDPAVCYSFVLTDAEGTNYFYWIGVGDDSFPMTPAYAEMVYRQAMAEMA